MAKSFCFSFQKLWTACAELITCSACHNNIIMQAKAATGQQDGDSN